MRSHYKTKQREAILAYIASLGDGHVTAAQIIAHFEKGDTPIGRTTVYRHLERLTESGRVRRYAVDGTMGACFQYAETAEQCQTHMHVKCDGCGRLFHLHCDMLDTLRRHFSQDHAFRVNAIKTVVYGRCENCLRGVQ